MLKTLFEGPVGLILILIVLAVIFAPKLPGAAKGIAQSIKIFKKELNTDDAKSGDKAAAKKPDAEAADEKKAGDN